MTAVIMAYKCQQCLLKKEKKVVVTHTLNIVEVSSPKFFHSNIKNKLDNNYIIYKDIMRLGSSSSASIPHIIISGDLGKNIGKGKDPIKDKLVKKNKKKNRSKDKDKKIKIY